MPSGQDTAGRVLEAAKKLFIARGYSATSLRAIASEAGTSESGVLRFYEDKGEILQAVMAWCWSDMNDYVAEALRAGRKRRDDPRLHLIEFVRAALQYAEERKPTALFLVSHFRFAQAVGLDERGMLRNHSYTREYQEYRRRIGQLCARVVAEDPNLAAAGITESALSQAVASLIHGVTGGWYMSEQDPATHGEKVGIDEVLAVLRGLLYCGGVRH